MSKDLLDIRSSFAMADSASQEAVANSQAREDQTAVTTIATESTDAIKEPEKNGETNIDNATASPKAEDVNGKSNGKSTEEDPPNKSVEKLSNSKNGTAASRHRNGATRGAYIQGRNFKNKTGNKFDPSSAKETDDPVEIRKQVEFYFSDSNLPTDKFLFDTVGGSENKAVPIKTIHNFKRMRRFQPFSAVVAALKESSTLNVVEDDTAIQRKIPLSEETGSTQPEIQKVFENEAMSRSVYVKGFGKEESSSQFDIEAWFSKFGATNQVRLRRTFEASFKGSVFVEFDSEETAKEFLAIDPAPQYDGRDLIIKSKKQYCDEKVNQINSGAVRAEEPDERDWNARRDLDRKRGFPPLHKDGRSGRGRGYGRGGNRGRDSRRQGSRNDEPRDGKRQNDDKEDEPDTAITEKAPAVKQTEDSTETKKREREEDDESAAPAEKKTAIESEMTGGPQPVMVEAASAES